jgi:hypothetical protein
LLLSSSPSLPSPLQSQSSKSDLFGDWDSTDDDHHIENIPSLGHIFSTHEEMITYTKEWALTVGYALIIARTTKRDNELTRVYLRCDRGGKPKAGQEKTRLIDCQYQLAGHLRIDGWVLSCDQSKGKSATF